MAEFYSARGWEIPPLPWTNLSPPFSIKTGARLLRHGRYAAFQMAEASLPRAVFAGLHDLIIGLRDPPAGALSA